MLHSNSCRLAVTTSLVCLVLAPVGVWAQEKGILWEQTTQAEVPGTTVQVPPITMKHCMKENWAEAPQAAGDPSHTCKNTNFNRSSNRLTWSVVCENPPMTGEGEITFTGSDSYTGVVQFKSADTAMQVSLTGKKIGSCDNPQ